MARFLILLILSALVTAAPLAAQTVPGLTGSDAPAEKAAPAAAETETLLKLLKDDTAREALIAQLEAAAAAPEDGATVPEEEETPSLGARFITNVQFLAERASNGLIRTFNQLKRVPGRLDDAIKAVDPGFLGTLLQELALIVALSYGALLTLRKLSKGVVRRIATAASHRRLHVRLLFAAAVTLIDAALVLLATGFTFLASIAILGRGGSFQPTIAQSAYLTSFAITGLALAGFRFFLAPRWSALRLINLSDAAAATFWSWLAGSTLLLVYGQFLLVPVASDEIGTLAGYALTSIVAALVVVLAFVMVLRHRREVRHWLVGAEGETPKPWMVALGASWHWLAGIYLLVLLFIVLLRPGNVLLPLIWTSAQVLLILLLALSLRNWSRRLGRRGVRLRDHTREMFPALERRINAILPRLLRVFRIALMIAATFAVLGVMGLSSFIPGLDTGRAALTGGTLRILGVLLGALLLWLAIASWIDYRLNPNRSKLPSSRETTLLTLLYNAATIAIVIFSLMAILSELGINIGPLIASAGVLGLAIGFGAQKLVQDIITGIFIQFENAINVGDVVTVGGITGTAEKLTVRSVSLRDVEGVFHIIPFSSVDMVSNYMRDFSFYVCDMGIAYREDIGEAKAAMHDAFAELLKDEEESQFVLGELEWFGLNSFGDSAIVLRARIKTTPGKQWGVGRAYNLILKRIFDERGIEIPFPHQTIYFGVDRDGKAPPLHIARDDAVAP